MSSPRHTRRQRIPMATYDQQLFRSRQLMFGIALIAGLTIAVLGARSLMSVQEQTTGKLGAADRQWEVGKKQEAVEQYKQMIALIDNPFFGGQVKNEELPRVYGRIIDGEMAT